MKNTFDTREANDVRAAVEEAFIKIGSRYECVREGKWLEFKVWLKSGEHFWLIIGQTKKVLNHCRRMCKAFRRQLTLGMVAKARSAMQDIFTNLSNCIRQAAQVVPFYFHQPDGCSEPCRRMSKERRFGHRGQRPHEERAPVPVNRLRMSFEVAA